MPRTRTFAWAATFLGLSGPFTEPMYFRARSRSVFAPRSRQVIARISDRFIVTVREFYYAAVTAGFSMATLKISFAILWRVAVPRQSKPHSSFAKQVATRATEEVAAL